MKRILLLSTLLLCFLQLATSQDKYVVTGEIVNVRQKPDKNSLAIGSAKLNDTIIVTSVIGDWAKISIPSTAGYIHLKYIKKVDLSGKSLAKDSYLSWLYGMLFLILSLLGAYLIFRFVIRKIIQFLKRLSKKSRSIKNFETENLTQTDDEKNYDVQKKSAKNKVKRNNKSISPDYYDLYVNLLPLLKATHELELQSTEEQKNALLNDFRNIILLFKPEVNLSYNEGFCFLLISMIIIEQKYPNDKWDFLNDSMQITELIEELLDSLQEELKAPHFTTSNFKISSILLYSNDYKEKLKKILYEFSEFLIKADGIITEQESEKLIFISKCLLKDETKTLTRNSLNKQEKTSIENILNELNNMVGLSNIKSDIQSLINIINVNKLRKKEGLPDQKISLHSVFIGPPGTGKTTIARILSNIYYSLEILSENNFVETDRSGLVAGYVGQTAIKTDNIITQAINGVLFIDEAYALKRGDSDNDYGQEAIDILLKRMEDNRDDLIIIVAGYEKEMNYFINSNPGLKSRFNRYFYFNDYTPPELTEIYKRISEKSGFTLSESTLTRVKNLFAQLYLRKDDKFGNARLARNIFEKTFEKHANRTATIVPITREILTTITPLDIPFDEFINSKN